MATTYHNDIQKLYVAYFNRPADFAGLNYWEGVLESNGGDLSVVSSAFAGTGEYKDAFEDMTSKEIVNQLYINLFGHDTSGDIPGRDYWAKNLDDKVMTVAEAAAAIAGGARGTDLTAYNNKAAGAAAFTAALDTKAEQDGYTGEDANALAKDFIASITTDASLTAAIAPGNLNVVVSNVVAAGTEFSVEFALSNLQAAEAARSEYLAEIAGDSDLLAAALEDADIDVEDATDADILDALDTVEADAEAAIDAIIPGFSSETSAAVQAAALALERANNAKDLKAANTALGDLQDDIDDMPGLADALADKDAAEDAVEAADEAAAQAVVDATAQAGTFEVKNGVTLDAFVVGTDDVTIGGTTVIAKLNADGEYELGADVDAEDHVGAATLVAKLNDQLATAAEADAAAEALDLATLNVHYMDIATSSEAAAKALAGAFIFNTPVIDDKASAQEIAAEQEAFADMIAGLNEAADTAHTGDTYASVLTDLGTALGAATTSAEIKAITASARTAGWISTADKLKIDAKTTGADAATALAANNWQAHSTDFDTKLATFDGLEGGATPPADVLAAQVAGLVTAVETAQTVIDDLADASAAYEEVTQLLDGLGDQDALVDAALAVFEDNDMPAPVSVAGIKFATSADDVFLAGSVDGVIRNFSALGDDTLYVGTKYTLNTGDLDDGKDAVLEAFIVKDGSNTIVYLETSVFGSSAADPEVIAITLNGVASTDVKFDKGFITVA